MRQGDDDVSDAAGGEEAEVDVAEAERWEHSYEKIPRSLQVGYSQMIGDFNLNTRIRIYKILDVFDWQQGTSELILNVFSHAKADVNIAAILGVLELMEPTSLYNILCIFQNIEYLKVKEILYNIPHSDILKLMDVVSFIDKKEFELAYGFIEKLCVRELIDILDRCNEPRATQCRLCKIQSLASLEYRLLNNQLRSDTHTHGFLPGMEPTYSLADQWQSDVDQGFTFMADRGVVFWRREVVDTMRICDKCLGNVIRAAGNVSRFEPIFHKDASEMKTVYKQLRQDEQQRAVLFQNLNLERVRRRVREWSIRALQQRRIQLLKDDEEDLKLQLERQLEQDRLKQQEEKQAMVAVAMAKDKKWMSQESTAQEVRTKNLVDYALLKNLPYFDAHNPVSTSREHPLSWRLNMYVSPSGPDASSAGGKDGLKVAAQQDAATSQQSKEGYSLLGAQSFRKDSRQSEASKQSKIKPYCGGEKLPLHALSSANRFGTASISPDTRLDELRGWKQEATVFYESIADRERREGEERRVKAAAEKAALLEYIVKRQASDEAETRRKRNAIEQAEADRIDRRLEDRLRRREAKLEREEAKERNLMSIEDQRSVAYQFLIWERNMEKNELYRMQAAENEQWKRGDRFWGIILHEIKQMRIAELRQAQWEQRVEDLREMCLNVKITRPFKDEKGVFRDFEYHLPIEP